MIRGESFDVPLELVVVVPDDLVSEAPAAEDLVKDCLGVVANVPVEVDKEAAVLAEQLAQRDANRNANGDSEEAR